MHYQPELNTKLRLAVDCYWEAPKPNAQDGVVFPSLPEPYVNMYFPIDSNAPARIKGISESADLFEMSTALFGVRLKLPGYFQLRLGPASIISNRLMNLGGIGTERESELEKAIQQATGFDQRVGLFQQYLEDKFLHAVDIRLGQIAGAFEYLVAHFEDPGVVQAYAQLNKLSPRTVSRWCTDQIGIAPKRLARVARFHAALSRLHQRNDPGFYLDCGYYDQPHFIREFKEFTSMTPESYLAMVGNLTG